MTATNDSKKEASTRREREGDGQVQKSRLSSQSSETAPDLSAFIGRGLSRNCRLPTIGNTVDRGRNAYIRKTLYGGGKRESRPRKRSAKSAPTTKNENRARDQSVDRKTGCLRIDRREDSQRKEIGSEKTGGKPHRPGEQRKFHGGTRNYQMSKAVSSIRTSSARRRTKGEREDAVRKIRGLAM